jgi:sugar phosphate isomerase/epimerase
MGKDFKIGVMVESFRLSLKDSLAAAKKIGASGIQLYATMGETHFTKLKGAALSDLKNMLADNGLEVAAVCGDFGGHGFQMKEENAKKIEDSKRVVDLARELNSTVITTHIGVVPADKSHPRYKIMQDACHELGSYAQKAGAWFAIETGPEPAAVLRNFLDGIGLPGGMGVNFDPANLVMVCKENIPQAVRTLAPYIRHTHAKDGINLKPVEAEMLYGSFAGDVYDNYDAGSYIKEVPLGQGGVNFPTYLDELAKTGYKGYLTIEREVGENPYADIEMAVNFLKGLMKS